MNGQARELLIVATAAIIAIGALLFFASYGLGRHETAWGIAVGAGIALIEFDSTAVVLMTLLKAKSKIFWGLLLASKSLVVFSLIGVLILVLKISGIGFIIGFSGLFLGGIIAGFFTIARQKSEG
jgi:hypothetical protein